MTAQSSPTVALEPCPFCGGEGVKRRTGQHSYCVRCENDGCGLAPAVTASSIDQAIAAWNRRAAPRTPAETGLIAALRKVVKAYDVAHGAGHIMHDAYLEAKCALANQAALPPSSGQSLERDDCQICCGSKGGVRGNENMVSGIICCDFCHADGSAQRLADSSGWEAGAEAMREAAANHARAQFDDRPRSPDSMDFVDGYDRATRDAEQRIRALPLPPPSPSNSSGWQPIETAPRDGTEVILWDGAFRMIGHWTGDQKDPECSPDGWVRDFCTDPMHEPTHWQPLPPPPSKEGAGA